MIFLIFVITGVAGCMFFALAAHFSEISGLHLFSAQHPKSVMKRKQTGHPNASI